MSVYHTPHYPYATSRDTTASGFLSEVGVSPLLVTEIIMAVRTYPIRVAGSSGPLSNEITWEEVRRRSGYPTDVREFTTTTKKLRRVALFDPELVKRAASVNRPTQIALHGADYLSYTNKSVRAYLDLERTAVSFITSLEEALHVYVSIVGTGPANEEVLEGGCVCR